MIDFKKLKLYLRSIPHHLECGSHSGFRYCCIFDYSVLDNFNHSYFPKIYRGKRYINKVVCRLRGKRFYYIPCPICMMFRNPKQLLSCKGKKHYWNMSLDQLKETVDWDAFNILSENLKKIDFWMDSAHFFIKNSIED